MFLLVVSFLIFVMSAPSAYAAGISMPLGMCEYGVPAGAYCDGTVYFACPVGYYCTGDTAQPTECPAGYYCDTDWDDGGCELHECSITPIACPDGTYSTGGAYECTTCGETPCDPTTGAPVALETPCGTGVGAIKTGTGLSFTLYAEKYTQPALCVSTDNGICYGKLAVGHATNTININYNGTIYHLVN